MEGSSELHPELPGTGALIPLVSQPAFRLGDMPDVEYAISLAKTILSERIDTGSTSWLKSNRAFDGGYCVFIAATFFFFFLLPFDSVVQGLLLNSTLQGFRRVKRAEGPMPKGSTIGQSALVCSSMFNPLK
jgi:hypothetical protein